MSRIARMIIDGEKTVYHVISRTVLDGYPLGDEEKDELVNILLKFSKLYFIDILGFCIMGDHFHLLVRMLPAANFSDTSVRNRYKNTYEVTRKLSKSNVQAFRTKWASLSELVREIKQTFSRIYNKRHDRRGFLWSERFKSLIVEDGDALISCLAYIDLNPIRAGITDRPDRYRWNSLGYHVQMKNKGGLLSLDFGWDKCHGMNDQQRLRNYRQFIYDAGAIEPAKGKKPLQSGEKVKDEQPRMGEKFTREYRFLNRNRYFSDAGVIGSKAFVSKTYHRFKDNFVSKIEKKPKPIRGLTGIYSMKRLTE